jgi:hypothetical protein
VPSPSIPLPRGEGSILPSLWGRRARDEGFATTAECAVTIIFTFIKNYLWNIKDVYIIM